MSISPRYRPLCPTWRAYGIAVPTIGADHSTVALRPHPGGRVVGVFSLHITGGIVVALLVSAWWLRGTAASCAITDLLTLAGVARWPGWSCCRKVLSVRQQERSSPDTLFPPISAAWLPDAAALPCIPTTSGPVRAHVLGRHRRPDSLSRRSGRWRFGCC